MPVPGPVKPFTIIAPVEMKLKNGIRVFFIERKLKIDDPVGAIAVHGICGTFGVLAVGIFANGKYGALWNSSPTTGVKGIIQGDWGQLGAQALAILRLGHHGGGHSQQNENQARKFEALRHKASHPLNQPVTSSVSSNALTRGRQECTRILTI
jgi:hypothetical protein